MYTSTKLSASYFLLCTLFLNSGLGDIDKKYGIELSASYIDLDTSTCRLETTLIKEIKAYQSVANKITKELKDGTFVGKAFEELAYFVDNFDARLSGSRILEESIDYMKKQMQAINLVNIEEELATVPKWVRGKETAEILQPKQKKLRIAGLGTTVGTPKEGIIAEVLVVTSMEDLYNKRDLAKGKIILFDYKLTYYDAASKLISNAASNASFYGGVAALTRSLARISTGVPHAKVQRYTNGIKKIPVAALAIADVDYISRLIGRCEKVVIHLKMNIPENAKALSRNLVGDWKGSKKPNEVVVISGHIDSWDLGQGAQDDGVGLFLAFETVKLLQHLNLRPKRTIRTAFWTAEEVSSAGITSYITKHSSEFNKHSVMMESDIGCFRPVGFHYYKNPKVGCILAEISKLFPVLNITKFVLAEEFPTDLDQIVKKTDVPVVHFIGDDNRYFWYHHTSADTMSAIDTKELDQCLSVWATTAYILADLSVMLPR